MFVASGPDTTQYMPYFRQHRLTDDLLIDTRGQVMAALRTEHSPLALVVDDSARVVYMDFRSPAATKRAPLGLLLVELKGLLSPEVGQPGS